MKPSPHLNNIGFGFGFGFSVFIIGIVIIFIIFKKFKLKEVFKEVFKEGFSNSYSKDRYLTWSKKTVNDFLIFQKTVNPNTQFNMEMIQWQASEKEARELIATGSWPWSQETEYAYLDAVAHNTILKMSPAASMEIAKTVYNEKAILQLLSWNTKEGKFLLNGTLIKNANGNGTIRCTTNDKGETSLQQKILTGYDLWNGYGNYELTNMAYENIPRYVDGFHFIKGACNPCVALDNDYSCPFQISVENDSPGVNPIWKRLWNI